MIVLAADYVGYEICKYLTERQEKIDFLVLDEGNRNNYNEEILKLDMHPNCKIIYSDDLKNAETLQSIKDKNIEFGISAWWPYILKKDIIKLTSGGWVNTHPSYLPFSRGKHPYFWSLVEEVKFGATIHFIDEGIDSGNIIKQEEIQIDWLDTGETLYNKSRELAIKLFKEAYTEIVNNSYKSYTQNLENGTFHYGKEIEKISLIDLEKQYKAKTLFNIIRGRMFKGTSNSFFCENGKKYSVKVIIEEVE